MPTFTFVHRGKLHTVRLERAGDGWIARIAERVYPVRVEAAGDGMRLIFEDEQALAWTAAEGGARHVWIDGEQITLTAAGAQPMERKAAAAEKQIRAGMPGQVRAVLAAAGDSVKAGQTLVVLEAMKMEMRAAAPFDGTVAVVRVQVGDAVERGAILAEMA
jgi:biotin carboxyl carrier protein